MWLGFSRSTCKHLLPAWLLRQAMRAKACAELGVHPDSSQQHKTPHTEGIPAWLAAVQASDHARCAAWCPLLQASAEAASSSAQRQAGEDSRVLWWHHASDGEGALPSEDVACHALAAELAVWLPASLAGAAKTDAPHTLASGVHRLAKAAHTMYETNRVTGSHAGCAQQRHERLLLFAAADVALRWGLQILGVPVLDRM